METTALALRGAHRPPHGDEHGRPGPGPVRRDTAAAKGRLYRWCVVRRVMRRVHLCAPSVYRLCGRCGDSFVAKYPKWRAGPAGLEGVLAC